MGVFHSCRSGCKESAAQGCTTGKINKEDNLSALLQHTVVGTVLARRDGVEDVVDLRVCLRRVDVVQLLQLLVLQLHARLLVLKLRPTLLVLPLRRHLWRQTRAEE